MVAGDGQRRIEYAQVDWVAGAPRSISFSDVYWSQGGPAEKRHVFIEGAKLPERFADRLRFAIAEIGFGAGLSFLETWKQWREVEKRQGARLRYHSFEAFPLSPDDLARAHALWPAHDARARRLRAAYPPPVAGPHILSIDDDVELTLHFGDAGALLDGLEGAFDAWFFDGFAPSKNPELWRPRLFEAAARLSRPGAVFATYAVAGSVRAALRSAGFEFEKRKGFGRKKEMIAGRAPDAACAQSRRAPWHPRASAALAPGARLAIIGGGIAGASLAAAARRAGLAATIIEAERLGAGASGNQAGLIMPRLDLGGSAPSRFFIAAYVHSLRLLTEVAPEAMIRCGALSAAFDDDERARQRRILSARLLPEGWAEARPDGLFFPQASVIDPAGVVRALAGDSDVLIARARRLVPCPDGVEIVLEDGSAREFDAAVLANGADALRFRQAAGLPLAQIAGQIDWFRSAPAPSEILAFGPYAAPAPDGGLVLGATYGDFDPATASRANLAAFADRFPEIVAHLSPSESTPRRAFRCQTPDRFPIAGPLPDLAFYGARYDDLRLGRRHVYPKGRTIPRVYALTGLGSRGFVTAPLAAAHVVAEIAGVPSPLDFAVAEALHPARFFIRDLKRASRRRNR